MSGRGGRSVKGMFSDSADSVKSPGRTVVTAAAQEGENSHSALKSHWAPLLAWTVSLNPQSNTVSR